MNKSARQGARATGVPEALIETSARAAADDARETLLDGNRRRLHALKAALASHRRLNEWIHIDRETASGHFEGARFESAFVPLIDAQAGDASGSLGASPRQPIAWRAKLRAFDRAAVLVSSAAAFSSIENDSLLVAFDRMTRTLHSLNCFSSDADGLLFLPVHERLLLSVRADHGKRFAEVLLSLGLNPARVVIDIPAEISAETRFLGYLIDSYHRHGFKVATNIGRQQRNAVPSLGAASDFIIVDSEHICTESAVSSLSRTVSHGATQVIFDGAEDATALVEKLRLGVRYIWAPSTAALPAS